MLDRYEKLLKIACLIFGALLLVQLVRLAVRPSPVAGLNLPAIPTWIERTNTGAQSSSSARTNSEPKKETNIVAAAETNSPSKKSTNTVVASTNTPAQTNVALVTTNSDSARTNSATNAVVIAKKSPHNRPSSGPSRGNSQDLPPLIQARIDRVLLSETFGALPHPVSMGLLGIAGDDVFLRTTSGETGMIKEGGELGGVKLLKIGINRVLVESDGEKKELMIFSGVGGESLLSKEKEKEPSK